MQNGLGDTILFCIEYAITWVTVFILVAFVIYGLCYFVIYPLAGYIKVKRLIPALNDQLELYSLLPVNISDFRNIQDSFLNPEKLMVVYLGKEYHAGTYDAPMIAGIINADCERLLEKINTYICIKNKE